MGIYANKALLEQKQIQALNEVYFGRTASIDRVYNAWCDWREKYANTRDMLKGNINAQNDPALKFFCKEVEREWNFYSVSIIINQTDLPNACTYCPIFGVGPDKIEVTKTGYRFKDGSKVSGLFILNAGLMFDAKYSNEETFAIFLHEVGHNFQACANSTIATLNWATELVYVYQLILAVVDTNIEGIINNSINILSASTTYNTAVNKIFNSVVVDNKFMGKLYSIVSLTIGLINNVQRQVQLLSVAPTVPLRLIVSGLTGILAAIVNPFGSYKGYMDERFADGFPASYGFAVEKASALYKLDSNQFGVLGRIMDSLPIIGHIYNATLLPGLMLIMFGDVHPNTSARAYSIISDLKTDLKDPRLDPKLKKQLEQEINEYEKNMDAYFKEAKRIDNPQVCKAWLDEFLYHKANGGLKYKLMDPNNKFRSVTNKTAEDIKRGKYDINKNVEFAKKEAKII